MAQLSKTVSFPLSSIEVVRGDVYVLSTDGRRKQMGHKTVLAREAGKLDTGFHVTTKQLLMWAFALLRRTDTTLANVANITDKTITLTVTMEVV